MASEDEIDDLLAQAGLGASDTPAETAEAAPTESPEAAPEGGVEDILSQLQTDLPAAETETPGGGPVPTGPEASSPAFPSFESGGPAETTNDISLLENVNVRVQVLLGRCKLSVEEILRLGQGSVVELDKLAGEPLDILVNEKLVAQGEVLVLNENFCVRVTDIIPPEERG